MMRRVMAAAAIGVLATAGQAWAQARPANKLHLQIDAGVAWTGGGSYGSASADLTRPDGGSQPLFVVSNELGAEVAMDVHLSFHAMGRLRTEITGSLGRADARARVSGDAEGAASITAANRLTIVTIQGAGVWTLRRRGHKEPFFRAGAGWMRELTNDNSLAGDGTIFNAGAGVKYWWIERPRGSLKMLGLRVEARLVGRFGGLDVGTKSHLVRPGLTAALTMGF